MSSKASTLYYNVNRIHYICSIQHSDGTVNAIRIVVPVVKL